MADVDAWPQSAGVMVVGVGLELLCVGGAPTDNMLSVSCKDAQHINRDMLHHDGFRLCASSWDKSGNGSAEMGPFCLPPFGLSAPLLDGSSGERAGGEGGGRGASCKWEADRERNRCSCYTVS